MSQSFIMTQARFANLVAALGTALSDAQSKACAGIGVLPSDAAALITVGQHPKTAVGALAPIIGFTPSAAVRAVDRLVVEGLMARERGADRREVLLSLTPAGAALRTRLLDARRQAVEKALRPLDSRQRAALQAIVETMLTALTDDRAGADHLCRLCDEAACTPATCPVECAAIRHAVSS